MSFEAAPGARIGRWKLQEHLGQGAFGSTWRATGEHGDIVAVKILREMPGDELRTLSRVCHPGVVGVLDGGGEPVPYVVMEYAAGRTLTACIKDRKLKELDAISIAGILCDALAALHHVGISHGDLKPDNLIIGSTLPLQVKLVDFGLAGVTTGGTLMYAAPERTEGKPSSPASDVYAAGLILFEMLHGRAPWAELEIYRMVQNRRKMVPSPTVGLPWVREILVSMLQVDPAERPSAATLADAFAAHGVAIPETDAALLRRRLRTVHVKRPQVETAIGTWIAQGGVLALVGTSGSGRSHAMERVVTELQALGRPWVRLIPGTLPWVAVEQALSDPLLVGRPVALPTLVDPEERASAAARALLERTSERLAVIVDDLAELDPGSLMVLERLSTSAKASILATCASAPAWAPRTTVLQPFGEQQILDLVSGILGAGGVPDGLLRRLVEVGGGVPGPTVNFLLHAVREKVLLKRAHRWLVVGSALDELLLDGATEATLDQPLSAAARQVGAVLAIHDLPLPLPTLAMLLGEKDSAIAPAVQELVGAGLVRVEARIAECVSRAARKLLASVDEAPAIHRFLVTYLRGQPEISYTRLGWHIVGARDAALAAEHGPRVIAATLQHDAGVASRLADALWDLAPVPALVVPRIQALVGAGHVEEARAYAENHLKRASHDAQLVPVLVSLARIQQDFKGDTAGALATLDEARRLLGGRPPPPEWYLARATSCLAGERHDDAIEAAGAVARGAPGTSQEALDHWLTARRLWAQALNRRGSPSDALAVLDEIPADLGQGRAARALLDATRGLLLQGQGRIREAAEAYARAATAEAGLSALQRARLLNNVAACKYQSWDRLGALASWEEALLLFERLAVPVEQVRVQINLCLGYQEQGRWERARQAGEWAVKQARSLGMPDLEAMALGNLGDLCLLRSSFDEAAACFKRAEQLAAKQGMRSELAELACRRAELAIRRHERDVLTRARRAERLASEDKNQVLLARALGYLAVGLAQEQKRDEALASVQQASATLAALGATAELASLRLWAAEAHLLLKEPEEALAIARSVVSFAEEVHHPQLRVRAEEIRNRVRRGGGPPRAQFKMDRILELATTLTRIQDLPTLLDRIADAAVAFLNAERAFVLALEQGRPVLKAARCAPGVPMGKPSNSVVKTVIFEGREVIHENIPPEGHAHQSPSVSVLALRMVVCVPLRDRMDVIGAIYVDSRQEGDKETAASVDLIRALASFASVALSNAKYLRETQNRARKARHVAHEIKRPVANMVTFANELLRDERLEPGLRTQLGLIVEEGERAIGLARQYLDDVPSQKRALDLSALLREASELCGRLAQSRGVHIVAAFASGLAVQGNWDDLHRCFANLLGNALRYAPPETSLEIGLEESGNQAEITIRDEGPGISADLLPRIFEEGVRGRDDSVGYGLGLAIAREIVEDHGGRIEAGNHPRGGAVFTIRLPLLSTTPDAAGH